jgi:hypothetical protein
VWIISIINGLRNLRVHEKRFSQTSHRSDVTTGEVGPMVREVIKRGEQAITEEAKVQWRSTSRRKIGSSYDLCRFYKATI